MSPSQLPQEGLWCSLHDPVATPTRANGDWSAWAHLGSKSMWRSAMQRPAELICQVLERQSPPNYPACKLCARKRGFQEHLPAEAHFRVFWEKYLKDGQVVEILRPELWDTWPIARGFVRLNYADGSIEMCRGVPPTAASAPSSSTSAPQDAVPGGAAAPVQRPADVAPQRSFGEVPALDEGPEAAAAARPAPLSFGP